MSVDEKYVEQIKIDGDDKITKNNNEMSFEEFLKSRGETAEKIEENEIVIPFDYKQYTWNQLVNDEVYGGKPVLSEIIEKKYPNTDVIKEYVPELLNELGWDYTKIEEVLGHKKAKSFFNEEGKLCDEKVYQELCNKIAINKLKCFKPYEELLETSYVLELVLLNDGDKEAYIVNIGLNSDENIQQVGRKSKLFKLRVGLYELDYPGASLMYNKLGVNLEYLRKDLEEMPVLALKVKFVEAQMGIPSYNDFVVVDVSKYSFE